MNAKSFMKVFRISPKIMISREDSGRWIGAMKDMEKFSVEEVIAERDRVIEMVGKGKPRLYYIEAVRRNLNLRLHEERKRAPVAPVIKDIMRAMFT